MREPEGKAPIVIKLGGRALEADGTLAALAAELAPLAGQVVLVHGGGPEVSAWSERLGLAPRFHEGRRVTDEATLEVAAAVLAGLTNKRLVAALRADARLDAVGIAALDGGTIACVQEDAAAGLGAVGRITGADGGLVYLLLRDDRTPVIASIGAHRGALLNLNADDVAAALAQTLHAEALIYLTDTPGLILGGNVVPSLDVAAAREALAGPDVTGGMKPKLAGAIAAAGGGVGRVFIGAWCGPGTIAALLDGAATAPGHATRIIGSNPVREDAVHGR